MKTLLTDVSTYDFREYHSGRFVLFDRTILAAGDMADLDNTLTVMGLSRAECTVVDGRGGFLLPGLVVGHTHLYSTFARGWNTPFNPASFQDILDQLWWKLDRALGAEEVYLSGLSAAAEYLKHGVTTVIDHHASGKIIKGSLDLLKKGVVDEGGLRALLCFESSDRFDIDACIEENTAFADSRDASDDKECRGLLGLHASFSLGDESLEKISRTPGTLPIHVHAAESAEDVQWTGDHCGQTPLERFDRHGLLRPGSLIVHGVHLSQKDFPLLKERGCTLVFNPTSNMNNGVGLPPVKMALDHGIPFLVGNDGLGFHINRDYQNLLFSSNLVNGPGSFPFEALLNSILSGYDYVNSRLGCRIGRIKQGYDADLILVPYDPVTPVAEDNIFGHFFYGLLENLTPSALWRGGDLKVSGGALVHPEKFKGEQTAECAGRLWMEIAEQC